MIMAKEVKDMEILHVKKSEIDAVTNEEVEELLGGFKTGH